LALLAPISSPAQIPFSLDATTWPEPKAINVVIPDSGLITLQLIRTNLSASTNLLQLKLLSFRDVTTGDPLPVRMYIPGQGSRSNAVEQLELQLQPGQALFELALVVPQPASTNVFLGSLGFRETNGLWSLQKLALHRPVPQKPATLVVEQPTLNVSVTCPLFGRRTALAPDVTVTIHDETRTSPLEGISVSPRAISSPARSNVTFNKNVVFFLNAVPLTNVTQSPTDSQELAQRSIAAGSQGVVGLAFVGLAPGDYNLELKLLALNSKDDDKQQRVTINIKVSHSFWPALATLILAMAVSFFTYKWLRVYQQRLGFQRRLAALSPPWLKELPPFYSVVWARTALEQTDQLIRKLRLVDPALITERVDKIAPVLDGLKEVHRARAAMHGLPQLVINRFEAVVYGYARTMSDQDMDKAAAQKAKDALSALNAELADNHIADPYWAEIEKEVGSFCLEISDKDLSLFLNRLAAAGMVAEAATRVNNILSPRKAPPKPADLGSMIGFEKDYMKVKLLYERQERGELQTLVKLFEGDLDKMFAEVDDADWNELKGTTLMVVPPLNDGLSAHEVYEPVRFSITTGRKQLDDSYLFHYGLKFKWHMSVGQAPAHPGPADEDHPLNGGPETLSPRIVYFSTEPGTLWVEAQVTRNPPCGAEAIQIKRAFLPVAKSTEFKIFQHLEWAEIMFLVLAGLFAIISGLLTFYYKNPTFGSFQDYLMLFLWGVGVDQTKNFLQVMQSPKPDSTP
jgi:hypothetical protein